MIEKIKKYFNSKNSIPDDNCVRGEKNHKKEKTLLEKYNDIQQNIKDIEKNNEDIILRSLERDFNQYCENIGKKTSEKNEFWHLGELGYHKIELKKYKENKVASIRCEFNIHSDGIEIQSIHFKPSYQNLPINKFKMILQDYIIYPKLQEMEKSYHRTKTQFNEINEIIGGKQARRDIILNKILNDQ